MSRHGIVVPLVVAQEMEYRRAQEAFEEDVQKRREEHRAYVKNLIDSLQLDPARRGVLDQEELVARIRTLAGRLLNMRGNILIQEPLALPEVGRLISDVLLGPGIEYEVLT